MRMQYEPELELVMFIFTCLYKISLELVHMVSRVSLYLRLVLFKKFQNLGQSLKNMDHTLSYPSCLF